MVAPRRKAVIDRIVDGTWAVLLVGRTQTEKVVPAAQLPEGAGEGTWLRIRTKGGDITEMVVDAKETETVQRRVRSKMEALRQRGRRLQPITPSEENTESTTSEASQAEDAVDNEDEE